jgi:hypothetical protein
MKEDSINKANEALANMGSRGGVINATTNILSDINKVAEDVQAVRDLWAPLFEKVGIIMKIVDRLADVSQLWLTIYQSVFSSVHGLRFIPMPQLHGQYSRSHSRFVVIGYRHFLVLIQYHRQLSLRTNAIRKYMLSW